MIRFLGVLAALFASGIAMAQNVPQGRLSLTPGTAVPLTSVSGATKVYYPKFTGDGKVPLYDGVNFSMQAVPDGVHLDLGSNWAAGSTHFVFVGDDAGTKRLCTGLGVGLESIQDLVVNSGAFSCRYNNSSTFNCAVDRCTYLGAIRIGRVAGTVNYVYGNAIIKGDFGVWNAWNKVDPWSYIVADPEVMYTGSAVSTDPFAMYSLGPWGMNEVYDYEGRIPVLPAGLILGEKTAVIMRFGDSNVAPTENTTFMPVNAAKVQELSLDNGGVYRARAPALGCARYGSNTSNGYWGHRLDDRLISDGEFQRVVGVCIAVSSSSTKLWTNFAFYNRFGVAYRRLSALGLLAADKIIIEGGLGGLDQIEGRSTAEVKANLDFIIGKIREAGFTTTPIYLALSSWAGGGTGGQNGLNVRAGILQAIADNANVFADADTDTIGLSDRYDGSHFSGSGSILRATSGRQALSGAFQ